MDVIRLAQQRAQEDESFSALLGTLVSALRGRTSFDLGRLYEAPYNDFQILIGLLQCWRLQRFRTDIFTDELGEGPR